MPVLVVPTHVATLTWARPRRGQVHCYTGGWAQQVVAAMTSAGFEDVTSLGGWDTDQQQIIDACKASASCKPTYSAKPTTKPTALELTPIPTADPTVMVPTKCPAIIIDVRWVLRYRWLTTDTVVATPSTCHT